MDDIIQDFLVESFEGLDQLDSDLVDLEQDSSNLDCIPAIFRTVHTIKGTCGFLGFSKLEKLTHIGENLLSKIRDGEAEVTEPIVTALLRFGDATREILQHIADTGEEGDLDTDDLVATLQALNDGQGAPADKPAAPAESSAAKEAPTPKAEPDAASDTTNTADSPAPENAPEESCEAAPPETPAAEPGEAVSADDAPVKAVVVEEETPKPQAAKEKKSAASKAASSGSIRVDVHLLDSLMNLVGELVLARNQILQVDNSATDSVMSNASQRLNLITTELQESVMKTRMQAIGTVCNKFPRIVRDLSLSCGKKARILIEGSETEVDRTIIEAVKDPLTHIVRNAVDHGIETPEERLLAGKEEEGLLILRAFHEGGQVNIEIKDDGAGLNAEALKDKARKLGLMDEAKLERTNESELFKLIFHPGFSTAKKVTNVSGRGVGMDVVKTNIEKIGGTIEISSERGVGTTFKIKIPLTLAIIPALMVSEGEHCFAIPQASLVELVRLDTESTDRAIEHVHSTPVYRLRGDLLPLVFLNEQLGIPSTEERQVVNIVVLKAEEILFGLVVGEVRDSIEIVVKPLSKQLSSMPHYAGATIMGDGQVSLILDVTGLARHAGVVKEVGEASVATRNVAEEADQGTTVSILVVETSCSTPLALELKDVARIEESRKSKIESTGTQEVLQYRGGIMPLFKVSDLIGCAFGGYQGDDSEDSDTIYLVVYEVAGKSIGLVVDRIIDVLEVRKVVDESCKRQGVQGALVVNEQVTELLDLREIINMIAPNLGVESLDLCEV